MYVLPIKAGVGERVYAEPFDSL